jgi:hypothetical protein
MTTKNQLLDVLEQNHGYDREKLKGETVGKLKELIELEQDTDALVEVDIEDDIGYEGYKDDGTGNPGKNSPLWNDYVMSFFEPEELYDGKPNLDGLRRVTEMLVGEIIQNVSVVNQCPSADNGGYATATATVQIEDEKGVLKVFSGVADAHPGNLTGDFIKYPSPMAETRAESRALRKALRLRTVSSEEIGGPPVITEETPDENIAITDTQLNMIDTLAKDNQRGMNINTKLLIENMGVAEDISTIEINKLTKEDGKKIIKTLSSFQKEGPPEALIGYESDWRK